MVKFYVDMIINGEKKWTKVPKLWNKKVQEALRAEGYTLNEDGTVSK